MSDTITNEVNDEIESVAPHDQNKRPSERRAAKRIRLNRSMLNEAAEQATLLKEFVDEQMTENIDYGKVPGMNGMTLLKPGAEKICRLYGCTPRYYVEHFTQDMANKFFDYTIRCHIYDEQGDCVAEGLGYCTSYESKYRFRKADRICPSCGSSSIKRSRPEYGNGWYCSTKHGGCGANYQADDSAITGQATGNVENEAIYDLVNTVLKMAMKRALVSAAQGLASCSGIFTQDLEDIAENTQAAIEAGIIPPTPKQPPEPAQSPTPSKTNTANKNGSAPTHVCNRCGVAAVQRSKYPPRNRPNDPPGWHCYERLGGCKINYDYESYPETPTPPSDKLPFPTTTPEAPAEPKRKTNKSKEPAKTISQFDEFITRLNNATTFERLEEIRHQYDLAYKAGQINDPQMEELGIAYARAKTIVEKINNKAQTSQPKNSLPDTSSAGMTDDNDDIPF